MNHIAPMPEPIIREIPLSRLALAPENVRKTPADGQADGELKASIVALTLLENLVVRTDEPNADGADRYAVVAGGRRLKAMQALVEDGVFDPDHPVPCLIDADPGIAGELSLAENFVRIAMHPADQVTAFTKLADAGQSVAAIAARFALTERLVEQRLRLGNAAPELLDAYRADAIDLEVLKAFAVTTDRARQMAAWRQVAGQGYRPSAWQVKRLPTEERVPGSAALARFVGVETYEAAAGKVLRDLFSADGESAVWFDDPALLNSLAMTKLEGFKDELATRWKWAWSWSRSRSTGAPPRSTVASSPSLPNARRRSRPRSGSWRPARTSSPSSTTTAGPRSWSAKPRPSRSAATRSRARSRPGPSTGRRTSRWPAASPPSPATARSRSSRGWSGWETVAHCPEDGDEEVDTSFVTAEGETLSDPVRFRRGWMLGDGTGCGKGRQVAAVILDNLLRLAGSLKLGRVKADAVMRMLQVKERPTPLARALAELGRIVKTIHVLDYVNDGEKRRRILVQLNRQEFRHRLARRVCRGRRGELTTGYREGQEEKLGALGLMLNVARGELRPLREPDPNRTFAMPYVSRPFLSHARSGLW